MKMDVDLQLDVFDSKISLVLECFCIFTIAIAFLLIIIVCVMNFIFYFSPKPLTKCDRGEKCIRKRPAQEPMGWKKYSAQPEPLYMYFELQAK